jgi:hypothetical protein
MSLNIKHLGSWHDASEVHIKHNSVWKQCKEVYIKKDQVWYPVLYEPTVVNITAVGIGTVNVPAGAFRATIAISGGQGGQGGGDGGHSASPGGAGAELTATVEVSPFTTLSYHIATKGSDGAGHRGSAPGGTGGIGYSNGGNGGSAGSAGSSGGGGAGGGASSIVSDIGDVIMVAAGGSGGSGSGNQAQLSASAARGKNSTLLISDENLLSGNNGGNGANCGTADGGAGGGGGGGISGANNVYKTYQLNSWGYAYSASSTSFTNINDMHVVNRNSNSACIEGSSFGWSGGTAWVDNGCRALFSITGTSKSGAGGAYMGSYDSDGYPGEAGVSYYNANTTTTPEQSIAYGNGSITITWLPE